jgi:hypothetical protein
MYVGSYVYTGVSQHHLICTILSLVNIEVYFELCASKVVCSIEIVRS